MNIKHLIGNPENCQSPDEALISRLANKIKELEKQIEKQQTPITAESLKAIGFINSINEPLIYKSLNDQADLVYNCKRKIFYIDAYEAGDFAKVDVYFASTEQIENWIKPFRKEGE